MPFTVTASSIALLVIATPMVGQTERKVTRLADGVYAIEHRDTGDGFASGNTTVIIGARQVFVVDPGLLPSVAREDLTQIRQWTDKPVSFVLDTHFHNDHNLGNAIYLEAFPALTIIAHVEAKKDMDRFGPGSSRRVEENTAALQRMLDRGKARDGRPLTAEEKAALNDALVRRAPAMKELENVRFQSATLTFEHEFTVELGNREVQVRFLGKGNTAGDAIVYLPKERIAVAGDLVVHPIPFTYDGYPADWIRTLDRLAALDAAAIVPGHGPVLHDKTYLVLVRDLLRSAVDQVNAKLAQIGPALAHTLDDVKGAVDLTPFRARFAGADKDLGNAFDEMAVHLIELVFEEARLR